MLKPEASIQDRFQRVSEAIIQAAQSAGRGPDSARLVVVTKAQPAAVIRQVVDAGARLLGENYPEETALKMDELGSLPVEWHMIGHLQSRKAGLVLARFDMLQSLDSLSLAEKLERLAVDAGKTAPLPVLLEFNVGGEVSKHGWACGDPSTWQQLLPDVERILMLPHLRVHGLMTMPPYSDDPEASRPYFVQLRHLADFFHTAFPAADWGSLSMGTSGDYPVAVQEGATLVRVGQAIVGPRPARQG